MDGFVKIAGIHEQLIKEVIKGTLSRKKSSELLLESVRIASENINLILKTSQDSKETLQSLIRYHNTLINDVHNFKIEHSSNISKLIERCTNVKNQIQDFSKTKHAISIRVKLNKIVNELFEEIKSLKIIESQSNNLLEKR